MIVVALRTDAVHWAGTLAFRGTSVAFSPDSQTLVTASSINGTIMLWSVSALLNTMK